MTRIRLTKKLAAVLNGVDVSALRVGDIIELPDSAAQMMIKEGWASPIPDANDSRPFAFRTPSTATS